jgi:hypothetical protein
VVLAKEFDRIICKELNATAGKWSCSASIGSRREVADLRGEIADRVVYIEVELRRDEPLTNVVKFWRAAEDSKRTKSITLVHAFSGHYTAKNVHRLNAEFIGKRMEVLCGVKYVPLSFKFRPRKGTKGMWKYRRRAAISLASDILKTLQA